MINLLPIDYKTRLHFGRLNIRLVQWLVASVIIIVGLAVILGIGWLYMDRQINNLNKSIAITENQLQSQNLEQVRKQAEQISESIGAIDKVLSREIRFSSLIQEIGQVMPPGTILQSLTLSDKVTGAIDLDAGAKNDTAAAQIAINLSDPKNNIFTKVDIVNISCSTNVQSYPCNAELRALFDQKTAERFLNLATEDKP